MSFPEIRISLRMGSRSSQIFLPPAAQIAAAMAVVAVAVGLCLFGVSRIGYKRALADGEAAVVKAETANADLQDEVANMRDKLALASRDRQQEEGHSSASMAPQSPGSGEAASRIDQLTGALEQTRYELHQVEAQRTALVARLSKVETAGTEHGQDKGRLEVANQKVKQLSADLDRALREKDRLRVRIAELEQRHSLFDAAPRQKSGGLFQLAELIAPEPGQSTADQPQPEMLISDAPPASEDQMRSVAQFARQAVAEARHLLASTGLNVDRLFPQLGQEGGRGGPFVVPPKGDQPSGMTPDKIDELRSLIRSLPLSVPLDYYQLESRFGPRRDPFNRRSSFHTGIDLSAPYMAPVHATAAGTVTYAGYRSDYGKVVEIDHGNGIATVYGHLHRCIVSVGQRVAEHEQIGLLGSSGRSSGPHVHYEILVNGEPQDPAKFISLARVIPAADR